MKNCGAFTARRIAFQAKGPAKAPQKDRPRMQCLITICPECQVIRDVSAGEHGLRPALVHLSKRAAAKPDTGTMTLNDQDYPNALSGLPVGGS